jgi:hypothetical protein
MGNLNKYSKLEESFHEQFAINQNHHQDILFKLLSIIGAVIVGYGYILHGYNGKYEISEAIFGLIVSEIILITGLAVVVINASGFRRDQNVCYRIRRKAEVIAKEEKDDKEKDFVFPYSFYPFKEKPCFYSWMPDFHKLFYLVFIVFQILSGIALIYKSVPNGEFCNNSCLIIFTILISLIISTWIQYKYTGKMKEIYRKEKEEDNE